MYTRKALRTLGVTQATLTDDQKRQLDEQGFFTVENVLSEADLAVMRAEFERLHGAEPGQGGHEVHVEPGARRLSNIFNKTAAFDRCLEIPRSWPRRPTCSARSRCTAPICATRSRATASRTCTSTCRRRSPTTGGS